MKFRSDSVGMVMISLLFSLALQASANNITVANATAGKLNTTAKTVEVVFDLSWENSWKNADSWDAAWVFVKFKAPGSNRWEHARLSSASGDHAPGTGGSITAVTDGNGVFIQRAGSYTGNVNYVQNKLLWNFGQNGYDFDKGSSLTVAVHAVEMVYIPQGSFYLGSGGTENGRIFQYVDGVDETQPFLVASEDAITVGTTSGNLYYKDSGQYPGDRTGVISNAFPKGFNAFYCMKYEVSQGQYADFLNTLTNDAARFQSQTGTNRFTIGGSMGSRVASAPDRACNFIAWTDGIAYADWAALRPMTELEFEKACRGSALPVVHEYAWGTTVITNWTGLDGDDGSGTETATPVGANCNYNKANNTTNGPVRTGIFARPGGSRQSSGAGYYGAMDLSGNLNERVVNIGSVAGRAFMGTLGDGVLDSGGNAIGNPDWPAAGGAGWRGGYWYGGDIMQRASDRNNAVFDGGRHSACGIRAVRQVP